jgi:hypothetical protein
MKTETLKTERTPGEWKLKGEFQDEIYSIDAMGDKMRVCKVDGASDEQRANAAFIVNACNNYDGLINLKEELHNFLSKLIGSSSLERIERFDLLETARDLFHKTAG